MAKKGRPSNYTIELGNEICEYIANGGNIVDFEKDKPHFPRSVTLFEWLSKDEDFRKKYEDARHQQAIRDVDQMLNIVDDDKVDPARAKLRMQARQWRASRYAKGLFGDQTPLFAAPGIPAVYFQLNTPDLKSMFVANPGANTQPAMIEQSTDKK